MIVELHKINYKNEWNFIQSAMKLWTDCMSLSQLTIILMFTFKSFSILFNDISMLEIIFKVTYLQFTFTYTYYECIVLDYKYLFKNNT